MSNVGGGSSRSADAMDQKPEAKKQRMLTEAELGGPIEDEETAREKLKKVGFDPDDIHEAKFVLVPDGIDANRWDANPIWDVNPICHFAGAGDLEMCRYLVIRGAITRESASVEYESGENIEWFPMLAAASHGMKDVCEWLYHHGAHADVARNFGAGSRGPLHMALLGIGTSDTAQWLILHGAIPTDVDGNLSDRFMSKVFRINVESFRGEVPARLFIVRQRLMDWAENVCGDHAAFTTFLHGTHPRVSDKERLLSPARFLGGHEGLRKKIADYVGVITGRNLRRVRGIVEALTKALADAYERGATEQPR